MSEGKEYTEKMQGLNETKFTFNKNNYLHSDSSDWEKHFFSDEIEFSDSESDFCPQSMNDLRKDEVSKADKIPITNPKGISPLLRFENSCHESFMFSCKGITLSELKVLSETHTQNVKDEFETEKVLVCDRNASKPKGKYGKQSDSENYVFNGKNKKAKLFPENKIHSLNFFPHTNKDSTQTFLKNDEITIYGHNNCESYITNMSSQGSLKNQGDTMVVSSQETYGSQTMIVSSQSSGSQPMSTSSERSSESQTMILSQESFSSQTIISSQGGSDSQKMIISSQGSSDSQKIISSQGNSNSQMINIASQESSSNQVMNTASRTYNEEMSISSQLTSSSITVSNQESYRSQAKITSGQENSIGKTINILNHGKGKWPKINISNEETFNKNCFAKKYNFQAQQDTKKVKSVTNTINHTLKVKMTRQYNKVKNRSSDIRKRELMVTKRENEMKIYEKLLAEREANVQKKERILKIREKRLFKCKINLANHFKKLSNISKKICSK